MKNVSRRKFIKGALAVLALLPAARIIKAAPAMQKDAVLTVDKDGNATLHGMTLAVDKQNNATVMLERSDYYERNYRNQNAERSSAGGYESTGGHCYTF